MDVQSCQIAGKNKETQIALTDKSCWGLDQTQPSYQSVNKWILHHPGKILLSSGTGLLWYPPGWDRETHTAHREWNPLRNTIPADFHVTPLSHTQIMRTAHQSSLSLFWGCSFAPLGSQDHLHGCEVCLSIGRRAESSLCERWNCGIADEWALCFPLKRNFKLFPILNSEIHSSSGFSCSWRRFPQLTSVQHMAHEDISWNAASLPSSPQIKQ